LKVGVLCLQGGYQKHIEILSSIGVKAKKVRYKDDFKNIDGLILPGGESTTFSKLIEKQNLHETLLKFLKKKPVYGTCAGLILMSKKISNNNSIKTFNMLDITVSRNAWGRQLDSFVEDIDIDIDTFDRKFKAIFIRAPKIINSNNKLEILSYYMDTPIMIKSGKLLGTTFHPELTNDSRIHKYFIDMIKESK